MEYFALELTGFPAFLVMLLLLYIFIYLPIKFAMTVFAHAKKKADRYKLLQEKTVIAEYDPPQNLSPAEIGFLYDAKLNTDEIYGSIIYLEQQGLLLTKDEGKRIIITEVRPIPQTLKEFDKYILAELSKKTGSEITQGLLSNIRQSAGLMLNRQLQTAGYLLPTREQIKRSLLRLLLITLSLMLLTIIIFRPNTASGIYTLVFLFVFVSPIYFGTAVFLYLRLQKISGEPWLGTKKLKEIWSDIEGYRQYISLVELDNLKFDSDNTKESIKNKSLPYAIALGFNTGWREKIK